MGRLAATLAALVALALPLVARGENASTSLVAGETLHGNIVTPGDEDRLEMYLPAGTLFSADLRAEKGSAILPTLEIIAPDESTIPLEGASKPGPGGVGLKVANLDVGPEGGTFLLNVIAGEGTSGKYVLKTKAKPPRKVVRALDVPASGTAQARFDAFAGTVLGYAVVPTPGSGLQASIESLRDSDSNVIGGTDTLKGKKIPLLVKGTYTMTVRDDGGAGGPATATFSLKPPKAVKRDVYLSPQGSGPAPVVAGIAPNRVLDDRPAEDIAVTGEGFDAQCAVRLERKGEEPLLPTAMEFESETSLVVSFDTTGVRSGKWVLVVENPSGGAGTGKFTVQRAGNVRLPAGVVAGTEVWWLQFDDTDFPSDLAAMGLGSSSGSVAASARAAVEQYVLWFVRRSFGLPGADGKVKAGNVPVSFVLEEPPSQVGAPGTTYNRLRIGGVAAVGDPSSNPSYAWGDSPLDPGNANYDDVSRDGGTGRGVMARALAPTAEVGTDGWRAALQPLQAAPLTSVDAIYFASNFAPADEAQGQRYRDIVRAVDAVGRELGGTVAHFVGRSMGVGDSASGVSSLPATPGGFLALVHLAFSGPELTALTGVAKTAGLPGTAKTLLVETLPWRETRPYLLPDATTGKAYSQTFRPAGGRPGRDDDDVLMTGIAGFIPHGFSLSDSGVLAGNPPLFVPGQGRLLHGGVFRFLVRATDDVSGEVLLFSHRVNLLVDIDDPNLTTPERDAAINLNASTLATP